MQQSGLKYRENAVWNKAMIARILDCEKYISEEFPAILPSDLFLQVQRLRKDRAQIYGGSLNPALRGIRDLICCQTCGQKLVRINHRDNDIYHLEMPFLQYGNKVFARHRVDVKCFIRNQ